MTLSTAPVVVARGVDKRYGSVVALSATDLVIPSGVTGLLGPNGAGKTTLIGLMLGLSRPDAGTIVVGGLDPSVQGADIRARVGYSPEHHLLPPDMAAIDLVRHMAEVHGIPRRDATSRASDALWYVGMGEERQRPLGTLSTGQRQRVKLASALAHDPRLLLLDEPTDGLDPQQRETMLDLIRKVGRETGIDVIMSSHLLDEVERTCDQVVILVGGEVRASGAIGELRGAGRGLLVDVGTDPAPLASRLLGRGCRVEVEGRRLRVQPPSESTVAPDVLERIIRDELTASSTPLRRLSPGTASLTEVYMGAGG